MMNNKFLLLVPVFTLMLTYYYYFDEDLKRDNENILIYQYFNKNLRYLLESPTCMIENLDPLNEEIKEFHWKVPKHECSKYKLLSYITKTDTAVNLNINRSLFKTYSYLKITCCYSEIYRDNTGNLPDETIKQSDCFPIESSVAVTHDIIKVECRSPFNSIYSNVHHIIQPVPKSVKTDKPSILLLGIDGMSKLNFMRSMPKTFTYLESYDWIGLKGYNKIEDNTYPNLMAFLTGQNWTDSDKLCDPTVIGKLDGCNFIWKEFKKLGYTTAYGEDTKVSTFNYLKKGFLNPPTDVYLKPYVIASLNLSTKWYCSTYYCSGPENAGQRMLDSVLDFSVTYKNVPTFGLFWINTFSHDDINCATSMDADVEMLLRKLYVEEILNDTIVVLLSDHGFRYGNIRYTHTGYMEERLPFIYFWIPEGYRKRYVKEYEELKRNAQRLTSPYDLYMTLQHVLKQVDPKYVIKESRGCSKCHSLMETIKNDRVCSDAGIPDYYCSCTKYFTTSLNRPIVKELGEFLVGEINAKVASYGSEAKGCAYYILYKVLSVKSLINKDKNEETFLIKIKTFPETIMEASINVNYAKHVFKIVDNISRLDRYGPRSYCVKGSKVSYYCYCKSLFMYVNHVLCNNIFCFL